mmetsp:Transcript_12315/g.24763  ORF Transcript_12315/g.24763 Transcript_12315/m.24763 type:complete len:358 (-) Transcript_12315:2721-3794(-)
MSLFECGSVNNGSKGTTASLILLIAVYLTLNTSLNLLNKWALGHYGLAYPLALTCSHMSFSFLVLSPFALRIPFETHVRTLEKQWKGILYIGSFMALNIALNNISLLDISLSLNQVIRSSIPVVTCLLAIVVEGKIPTHKEVTSLVILTVGVMIAVWQGTIAGKPHAILFCIIGTVCNGAMMTFSGKLLSEKLDVVRLTFYTAPVSLVCLAPFMAWRELGDFQIYLAENFNSVVGILLVSSINAVTYNLVHSLMIKKSSAVTTTVLGEIKIVGLLILSALILDEGKEFTPKMMVGCGMAMLGFIMYSQIKIEKIRSTNAPLPFSSTVDQETKPLANAANKAPTSPPPPGGFGTRPAL